MNKQQYMIYDCEFRHSIIYGTIDYLVEYLEDLTQNNNIENTEKGIKLTLSHFSNLILLKHIQ